MKSIMKRSGFGFQIKRGNFKNLLKIHFRVTKKDASFPFHFHVLNLFKSWSNLRFDQKIQTSIKFKKNQKNEKQKHIVFLCHIVSILN